MSTEW